MGKKRGRIQSVNELEVPKSGLLQKKTLTKSVSELRYIIEILLLPYYIVSYFGAIFEYFNVLSIVRDFFQKQSLILPMPSSLRLLSNFETLQRNKETYT